MIYKYINNKMKRLPDNLEDLDIDPPDGPAGIAVFFLILTDESVIMKRRRAKNQLFQY